MNNTIQSFKDKWEKNETLAFSETLRQGSTIFNWILKRNGFETHNSLKCFLKNKKRILDAGCGNGRVTALLRKYSSSDVTEIVGIDIISTDIAKKNMAGYKNVNLIRKDLLDNLEDLAHFDFIYCQEVLHHTANPEKAFLNLCKLLRDEGEIAIYVYKLKAPVREFVDDYVREKIATLSYEEAMKACKQITSLGRALAENSIKIKVPEVDVLAIEEGEYDLQRFLYHFFMKCFWNPDLSFQENAAINYDWYHPQLCSKHTEEEIKEWFQKAGLKITHKFVDFYGITMRGIKEVKKQT